MKVAIAASMLLTGCVFQPTLMNLKLGADAISYATTKKSTNDNIASAVTEKDCDTFNLLDNGKSYCRVKKVYVAPPALPKGGLTVTWIKTEAVNKVVTKQKRKYNVKRYKSK